jgi:hypothetical protein
MICLVNLATAERIVSAFVLRDGIAPSKLPETFKATAATPEVVAHVRPPPPQRIQLPQIRPPTPPSPEGALAEAASFFFNLDGIFAPGNSTDTTETQDNYNMDCDQPSAIAIPLQNTEAHLGIQGDISSLVHRVDDGMDCDKPSDIALSPHDTVTHLGKRARPMEEASEFSQTSKRPKMNTESRNLRRSKRLLANNLRRSKRLIEKNS